MKRKTKFLSRDHVSLTPYLIQLAKEPDSGNCNQTKFENMHPIFFFNMDHSLKCLWNLLQYCFCFMFRFFDPKACAILTP